MQHAHRSEERLHTSFLYRVCKSCFAYQHGQGSVDIVVQRSALVCQVNEDEGQVHAPTLRPHEVDKVQVSAHSQDTEDLAEGATLVSAIQMMK